MVARFRALGDLTRLRVVHELASGTRCVCDLREQLGIRGPLLSHHLAVLRDAGLVTACRRGRWVDYTLDTQVLAATCGAAMLELARRGGGTGAAELCGRGGQGDAVVIRTIA